MEICPWASQINIPQLPTMSPSIARAARVLKDFSLMATSFLSVEIIDGGPGSPTPPWSLHFWGSPSVQRPGFADRCDPQKTWPFPRTWSRRQGMPTANRCRQKWYRAHFNGRIVLVSIGHFLPYSVAGWASYPSAAAVRPTILPGARGFLSVYHSRSRKCAA